MKFTPVKMLVNILLLIISKQMLRGKCNFQAVERLKVSFPIVVDYLPQRHQTTLLDTSFHGHQEVH